VAPVVAHAPLVGAYSAYGLGLGYGHGLAGHYLGKRSADADPLVLAGSTKVLTAPTPFIHNPPLRPVAPVVAHAPLASAYGYGLPLGYGHYIGKREAEAEPQYPLGLAYSGLPLAYTGVLPAAGAVPHVPVVKSVEVTPAEVSSEVTAHAVPVAVGYHGLGHFGHFGYHG